MSKSIIIQEAGEPKTLSSIDKIITPKVGGGSAGWVLFENLDLMAKTVTKNGTYKAEDDNVYGYHKVTVKVPKKGKKKTGKRPQSSGDPNDYCVTTDDDGNLVYTKLPTSINIINPPSKTVYDDNELIKKDGMLVKAYFADGSLWGDVPLGEISLDPDRASKSSVIDERDCEVVVSGKTVKFAERKSPSFWGSSNPDEAEIHLQQVITNHIGVISGGGYTWATANGGGGISDEPPIRVAVINNSLLVTNITHSYGGWAATNGSGAGGGSTPYTYNNKTVYSNLVGPYVSSYVIPNNTIDHLTAQMLNEIAWSMWYGDVKHVAWENEITAKWNRPEDSKTLTDKFKISITESISSESSSNTGGNNTGGGGSSW